MSEETPRLGLNTYEQGDDDWDHTDTVEALDEFAIERGPIAERPSTGEYDDELYYATDQGIMWRWDEGENDWVTQDRGKPCNPSNGITYREGLHTYDFRITDFCGKEGYTGTKKITVPGDYSTIQEAIDSVPDLIRRPYLIEIDEDNYSPPNGEPEDLTIKSIYGGHPASDEFSSNTGRLLIRTKGDFAETDPVEVGYVRVTGCTGPYNPAIRNVKVTNTFDQKGEYAGITLRAVQDAVIGDGVEFGYLGDGDRYTGIFAHNGTNLKVGGQTVIDIGDENMDHFVRTKGGSMVHVRINAATGKTVDTAFFSVSGFITFVDEGNVEGNPKAKGSVNGFVIDGNNGRAVHGMQKFFAPFNVDDSDGNNLFRVTEDGPRVNVRPDDPSNPDPGTMWYNHNAPEGEKLRVATGDGIKYVSLGSI